MVLVIGIPKETAVGERRVGATPDTVKKWVGSGQRVLIEANAGVAAAFTDEAFSAAGAEIVPAETVWSTADILLKVRGPSTVEAAKLKKGATVVALLDAYREKDALRALASAGATAYAMEFVPRITRAQVMDALSSQANLAGYRAVIEAAHLYGKAFPMMMTAAGTVAPAKVFVMGVGVAGLQAIATARRLGAVVSATDVRPATKEQVESLGAKFIAVEDDEFKNAQTAGGYAKEMSDAYKAKQAELVSSHIGKQDIVITTALIPGRPAPRLVTAAQVASMKAGSVLIDLAAPQGGNVEGCVPDSVVETHGVKIFGPTNIAASIANDASALYAKNLQAFVGLLIKDGALAPDFEDEILKASLVAKDGVVVHPALQA
ncbi:Re/Si-specific NAD(P)(+) transhydrogenase subunit alpha [Asticcacaulis sp. AND118]|uniref:Re/Si-specific NAD(P)(+) transhydrogenase subunit alpha n=1 Tax=Asticcacaulis sp. AND118 TaxID=2840468 RepID=UPI001CFF9F70|nr:Re/Si-specific NAD(P)(+) transhydrogenase subunit alpha [Asticcacaulis sp. AND118]UDF04451.1 Re/Si-specific NAD(P)(+) transhydrogenase subunit alpha [Asticcacaulis sp. AND118]